MMGLNEVRPYSNINLHWMKQRNVVGTAFLEPTSIW